MHRWVADQIEHASNGSSGAPDHVPLVGYASEFLDRFLEDAEDGSASRCQAWVRAMVNEAVLAELTPLSLTHFLLSLKNAINTLWSMEAWSRPAGSIQDLVAIVETLAQIDAVLLSGLEHMQHKRDTHSVDIDSLELLEQAQREQEAALPSLTDRFKRWRADRTRTVPLTVESGPAVFDPTNEDFLARISHEFRSPLSSILSVCHMSSAGRNDIFDSDEPGKGSQEAFEIVERSARQLFHLTENLLQIQRTGVRERGMARFPLKQLADDLLCMFRPLAVRKGLELQLDLPADLPDVETDHESLLAVLRNLLANAINYTSNGHVELWAMIDPDDAQRRTLIVGVTDTGAGIEKQHLDDIFQAFWRAEHGNMDTRGTGLGLAIVRDAVGRLGGEIGVQSEPGKGSTFVVALPAVLAEKARA